MKQITHVIRTTKMLPIITAGRTGRRLGMIGYYNELFSLLNGFVVELLNVVQDVIVTLGR